MKALIELKWTILIYAAHLVIVHEALDQYRTLSISFFRLNQVNELYDLLKGLLAFLELEYRCEQYFHVWATHPSWCQNQHYDDGYSKEIEE